jgi:hypothetical protein
VSAAAVACCQTGQPDFASFIPREVSAVRKYI